MAASKKKEAPAVKPTAKSVAKPVAVKPTSVAFVAPVSVVSVAVTPKPVETPVSVVVPVQLPKVEIKPVPPPPPCIEVVPTNACSKCGKLVNAYETIDSATGKGFCSLLCYSKR